MKPMQDRVEPPFWMQGNFAPVTEEITAFDLPVDGAIPPELSGLYVRNGANPRHGQSSHWFLGDGMLHGIAIEGGKAQWYRNRYVRTPIYEGAPRTLLSGLDIRYALSNTSVVAHANRIMALVENALPMEISRELETRGFNDFGGRLATSCTAHPKICPVTGEMHFFGYRVIPPYLTYHVADAAGALVRSVEIPVKAATMIHDFALTARHAIFMDLPVVFDMPTAMTGSTMPFHWSESHGARLGVLSRGSGADALRWIDIEPCYVYHVANAFEEADGAIVLDVARYDEHWRGGPKRNAFDTAALTRWRIPPGATRAEETRLDDRSIEFPRIDDRRTGLAHGIVYALATEGSLADGVFTELLKYDLKSGRADRRPFDGELPSEFTMVSPAEAAGEDEGWLMGYVYNRASARSDLVILDAGDIGGKPVARVRLPVRVPQGFHGTWIASEPRQRDTAAFPWSWIRSN